MDWLRQKLELVALIFAVISTGPVAILVRDYRRVRKLAEKGASLVSALTQLESELDALERRLRSHEDSFEVHMSPADREKDRIVREQIGRSVAGVEAQIKEVRDNFMEWLQGEAARRRRG
jgi:hypothetical protein